MVDLVKIRKKKAKAAEAEAERSADLRSAGPPASTPAPSPPADLEVGGPADVDVGAPKVGAPQTSKLDKFKAEAGKRREAEAVRVEETVANQLELLAFLIAGEQYAVDIERIVEIVTPRASTRIPNADPAVVGIISLRGTIVTLVDVRRKLRHHAAAEETADTRVVVIDFQHEIIGFVVDRVLRVVKIPVGEVEPHPVVHATELDDSIRGVFRIGNALTILLDLDKLLDHRALATRSA